MKKMILLLAFAFSSIKTCRVQSNWVRPDLEESSQVSGAILVGTVSDRQNDSSIIIRKISLENITYYKGCGPNTATIDGFSSSASCGVSAPTLGTKVILFVCQSENGNEWKIHRFAPWTGLMAANDENLSALQKLYQPKECMTGQFESSVCLKRQRPSLREVKLPHIEQIEVVEREI